MSWQRIFFLGGRGKLLRKVFPLPPNPQPLSNLFFGKIAKAILPLGGLEQKIVTLQASMRSIVPGTGIPKGIIPFGRVPRGSAPWPPEAKHYE